MKNPDPAKAAYWQLVRRVLDLYVTLPNRKCLDAFRARLDEFKTKWPQYPMDTLEELLKGVTGAS